MLLALDMSTKATGLALFSGKELIKASCITASSTDMIKRIHKMVDTIDELIQSLDITDIILEEVIPDHQKNVKTFKSLMYLQAYFMILLHDKYPQIKVDLIYPSSWRSKVGVKNGRGIKREQLKADDVRRANELYGLNITSDDIADAILIGASKAGLPDGAPKSQLPAEEPKSAFFSL